MPALTCFHAHLIVRLVQSYMTVLVPTYMYLCRTRRDDVAICFATRMELWRIVGPSSHERYIAVGPLDLGKLDASSSLSLCEMEERVQKLF